MKETDEKATPKTIPPEVSGVVGGVTRRMPGPGGQPSDSMLAVYRGRLTYTFIFQDEVASIHFDRKKGEIFFKGHNVSYMELSKEQLAALWSLVEILAADREGISHVHAYRETLAKLTADNKK